MRNERRNFLEEIHKKRSIELNSWFKKFPGMSKILWNRVENETWLEIINLLIFKHFSITDKSLIEKSSFYLFIITFFMSLINPSKSIKISLNIN